MNCTWWIQRDWLDIWIVELRWEKHLWFYILKTALHFSWGGNSRIVWYADWILYWITVELYTFCNGPVKGFFKSENEIVLMVYRNLNKGWIGYQLNVWCELKQKWPKSAVEYGLYSLYFYIGIVGIGLWHMFILCQSRIIPNTKRNNGQR